MSVTLALYIPTLVADFVYIWQHVSRLAAFIVQFDHVGSASLTPSKRAILLSEGASSPLHHEPSSLATTTKLGRRCQRQILYVIASYMLSSPDIQQMLMCIMYVEPNALNGVCVVVCVCVCFCVCVCVCVCMCVCWGSCRATSSRWPLVPRLRPCQ